VAVYGARRGAGRQKQRFAALEDVVGTQFTSFTGTKVQTLTRASVSLAGVQLPQPFAPHRNADPEFDGGVVGAAALHHA